MKDAGIGIERDEVSYIFDSYHRGKGAEKKEGFGLLLVDIKMPEHDGMYLMREVKEKWPDIPIIVMSGYPTTNTIEEAVKMEAAAFIAKPFTPDELFEIIRQVIQKEEDHETKKSPSD